MSDIEVTNMLHQWEQTYKKGLLTFWILLSLSERPMYAYEMREKIMEFSQGSIVADENSFYRALKRFADSGIVTSQMKPSEIGPDRKYFELSPIGSELLEQFIDRNINVLQEQPVVTVIKNFQKNNHKERKKR